MGSGFLAVPYSFYSAGYLVGIFGIIVVSLMVNTTKDYLLESMARAEALQVDSFVPTSTPNFEISNRKFEITELTAKFFGPIGKRMYIFILCLYMYGSLWAYTSGMWSSDINVLL